MKSSLYIIGSYSLYGLSDSYEHEIVECVYDRIKPLKNGKYNLVTKKKYTHSHYIDVLEAVPHDAFQNLNIDNSISNLTLKIEQLL